MKNKYFRKTGAYFLWVVCYFLNVYLSVIHGMKKKTIVIEGVEMVLLRCNRDFTSASSYGLCWYKYAIATQWYQFHTTDAVWFSLRIAP